MELNDYYKDRGIVKYNGFYLSEHTSSIERTDRDNNKVIAGREQMSEELIFEIIDYSIYKNNQLSVQLNIKDIEGNFLEDIKGFIEGYDEDSLYINSVKVPLNQIRHIVEVDNQKWFK